MHGQLALRVLLVGYGRRTNNLGWLNSQMSKHQIIVDGTAKQL